MVISRNGSMRSMDSLLPAYTSHRSRVRTALRSGGTYNTGYCKTKDPTSPPEKNRLSWMRLEILN